MVPRAPFIGRADEVALVRDLLGEHRVVTLVGAGGIGKTRLALEASTTVTDRFPGGVYVAELMGVADGDDIGDVVARALGVDSVDALAYRAAGHATLLVLDNCESALVDAAGLAAALVAGAGDVRVLATSRAPLGVDGERLVPVRPLGVPDEGDPDDGRASASVQLFFDRAARAGAFVGTGSETVRDVARLVRQLDGIPLAIELAAARTRVLSPAQLAERLQDHLDLLRVPGRLTDRHRSMRAAISASYEPLPIELQRALRRLCVIAAPFDLDLAHALLGDDASNDVDTLDVLTELLNASVLETLSSGDGPIRYRLLEPVRLFAEELLEASGEGPMARDRYVDAMVAEADGFVAAAMTSFAPELLAGIRERYPYLARAIDWCIATDTTADRANRLFLPLAGEMRLEVASLARRVLATWQDPARFHAESRAVMGLVLVFTGDLDGARQLGRIAVEDAGASVPAAMLGHRVLAHASVHAGDLATARMHFDRAAVLARRFSGPLARQIELDRAATITDVDATEGGLARVGALARAADDAGELVTVVWAAIVATHLHGLRGDVDAAERSARGAVGRAHRTGHPWSVRAAYRTMATVLAARHGWAAAAPSFRTAFEASLAEGDLADVATTLRAAAGAALRNGDAETAGRLWATIPAGQAPSIVRSIFAKEQEQLAAQLGTPAPADAAQAVRAVRELLGPGTATDEPVPTAPAPRTAAVAGRTIRFGHFEIDPALCELRSHGERVHLEPQVFDVLFYLAGRRGTLVTKEELLDEIWGDRFVSESALSSRIKSARQATDDDGRRQAVIRTVHGRGYTFVAETR